MSTTTTSPVPVVQITEQLLSSPPVLSTANLSKWRTEHGSLYQLQPPATPDDPNPQLLTMVVDNDLMHKIFLDPDTFLLPNDETNSRYYVMFGSQPLGVLSGLVLRIARGVMSHSLHRDTPLCYFGSVRKSAANLWASVAQECGASGGPISIVDAVYEACVKTSVATFGLIDVDKVDEEMAIPARTVGGHLRTVDISMPPGPCPDDLWQRGLEAADAVVRSMMPIVVKKARHGIGAFVRNGLMFRLGTALRNGEIDLLTMNLPGALLPSLSLRDDGRDPKDVKVEDLPKRMQEVPKRVGGMLVTSNFTAKVTLAAVERLYSTEGVLDRIRAELKRIGTTMNDVTVHDFVEKTPLLDSFVFEAARMSPPALNVRYPQRDTTIQGVEVKKGALILLDVWGANMDERYFENPMQFKADRFVSKSAGKAGARMMTFNTKEATHWCIGSPLAMMQIKVYLATAVYDYDVETLDGQYSVTEKSKISG